MNDLNDIRQQALQAIQAIEGLNVPYDTHNIVRKELWGCMSRLQAIADCCDSDNLHAQESEVRSRSEKLGADMLDGKLPHPSELSFLSQDIRHLQRLKNRQATILRKLSKEDR